MKKVNRKEKRADRRTEALKINKIKRNKMTQYYYIDPPEGWLYGFPKKIKSEAKDLQEFGEEMKAKYDNLGELCVQMGYPRDKMDKYGQYFSIRTLGPALEDD